MQVRDAMTREVVTVGPQTSTMYAAAVRLLAAGLTAQLLVVGHRRRNRVATLTPTTHGGLHRARCPVAVAFVEVG